MKSIKEWWNEKSDEEQGFILGTAGLIMLVTAGYIGGFKYGESKGLKTGFSKGVESACDDISCVMDSFKNSTLNWFCEEGKVGGFRLLYTNSNLMPGKKLHVGDCSVFTQEQGKRLLKDFTDNMNSIIEKLPSDVCA